MKIFSMLSAMRYGACALLLSTFFMTTAQVTPSQADDKALKSVLSCFYPELPQVRSAYRPQLR